MSFRDEGLIEVCTASHGQNGPTTYDRGQRPIDGIFVTSTLLSSRCVYLPFEFDHRALWIDIPMSIALGHDAAEIKRPAARRLKNNDPRVRNRYLKLYSAALTGLQLFERLDRLMQRISKPPSQEDVKEYNLIDGLRTRASGPSRLHFGHFIANAHDEKISLFDSVMAAIPHATGLSPRRWQYGIDCKLEKKAGNTRVDSLQTILLFEADANQNFKKVGRDMMYLAEELHALAPEQFGSRKTLSSVDQSLNKRLTFDLMRQLKRPGALCSNDAKSCNDRVVHSIASICTQ